MQKKTAEDYLGAIYRNSEEKQADGISSIDIAKDLNVSKPSVSEAIRKLKDMDLVIAEPYSKIFLTDEGKKLAKKIIHNHRVIEYFLRETLKCDLNTIHNEAHKLEHALSDDTIERLDSFLGNPKISPYGKRIH